MGCIGNEWVNSFFQFFELFHRTHWIFFFYMKLQTSITYNLNILYTVAVPLKLQNLIFFEKCPKNISENLPG